jgi:hypothetical protein
VQTWTSDRLRKVPEGSLKYESHHLPPRRRHDSSSLLGRGGRRHATEYQMLKLSIVRPSQRRRTKVCDLLWNAAMVPCPAELCFHYRAARPGAVKILASMFICYRPMTPPGAVLIPYSMLPANVAAIATHRVPFDVAIIPSIVSLRQLVSTLLSLRPLQG